MKESVKTGTIGEERFVVSEQHVIDFSQDEMPPVLSTPWLIWFLEHAARNAMLPLLEPGESTVGVAVNMKHLVPTPIGQKVVCRARVVYTNGSLISFQIEAHDECEKIAQCTHKLRVIKTERMAKRIKRKIQ